MTKILEIKNLVKKYGSKKVLDDVSFSLEKGCVCGFLGPNGAGKTTTMKIIVGLLEKTSGEVIKQDDVSISYLQDVPQFYEFYSVYEYLDFLLDLKNDDDKSRIDKVLELVGLSKHKSTIIKKLSRGLRQRVGIASSIINKPDILILDEPVSALDPIGRKEIFDLIDKLSGNMTIIFSSHILSDAEKICDQIIIIDSGKILMNKKVNEIELDNNILKIEFNNEKDLNKFVKKYKDVLNKYDNTVEIEAVDIKKTQEKIFNILLELSLVVSSISIKKNTLEEIFISEVSKNA